RKAGLAADLYKAAGIISSISGNPNLFEYTSGRFLYAVLIRLPYKLTFPKYYAVASEATTLTLLRAYRALERASLEVNRSLYKSLSRKLLPFFPFKYINLELGNTFSIYFKAPTKREIKFCERFTPYLDVLSDHYISYPTLRYPDFSPSNIINGKLYIMSEAFLISIGPLGRRLYLIKVRDIISPYKLAYIAR
ncbi:uncharacterized protein N7477_002098, partial [Penicillium maclennaniae]|uniref:uncharacterized protein n=1 Tax=Penicillium maclennaniae TaxID=1343394 RepID=UPI00253FC5A5